MKKRRFSSLKGVSQNIAFFKAPHSHLCGLMLTARKGHGGVCLLFAEGFKRNRKELNKLRRGEEIDDAFSCTL